jgi:hypothetical protein
VRAAFVAEFGSQDILMAPIDEGFNKLAWLVPYVVGAIGLAGAFVITRRWSSQSPLSAGAPADLAENSELRTRLDDELRDLD